MERQLIGKCAHCGEAFNVGDTVVYIRSAVVSYKTNGCTKRPCGNMRIQLKPTRKPSGIIHERCFSAHAATFGVTYIL